MAQRRRPNQNKRQAARVAPALRSLYQATAIPERQAPVVYGKPFIVAEDEQKNTFVFKNGEWTPLSASMAEMRRSCLVKELPQRLKNRVRYEVRAPQGMEP